MGIFLFTVLVLIKMQPDLGTDILIAAIVGMMIFLFGYSRGCMDKEAASYIYCLGASYLSHCHVWFD
ncbi:hypothetical protein GCM10020331_044920 [Ectobacillus funiculus]